MGLHFAEAISNRKTAGRRRNHRCSFIIAVIAGFAISVACAFVVVAAQVPNISVADQGANGGNGTSFPVLGEDGDNGENGGNVATGLSGSDFIITVGNNVRGISARSIGGNGGNGGNGTALAVTPGIGGDGGNGGNGGNVTVNSAGDITTSGTNAHGIFAESHGGNGGNGGDGNGVGLILAQGGDGGAGGSGGTVTVVNGGVIVTNGASADGIRAQSLGGAGGDGGSGTLSVVGQGGAAAGSGPGGNVTVTNLGRITTHGAASRGIFAQSVGGFAGDAGAGGGIVGFGGGAQSAGDGGVVTVTNSGAITTTGSGTKDAAPDAIFAQSVGGGGGDGGGSGGLFSFGGSGSAGGDGRTVTVNNTGALATSGFRSNGIFAESVGGGGGNGGGSISVSAFAGFSLGGSGGSGGAGGQVNVSSGDTTIVTVGDRANGLLAQSVGGGGGNGGYAVTLTGGIGGSVSVAVGGSGGGGGGGGSVHVNSGSGITTAGNDAIGIFAQSVGGGGGSGGFAISGAGSDGIGVALAFGGSGGSGGGSSAVTVMSNGAIIGTAGDRSIGILAQSVGGGGGNGGFSIAGAGGGLGALSFTLGGSGGGGGNGSIVDVTNSSSITTHGIDAQGIFAQSLGGGGGNGGFSIAAAGAGTGAGSISVGGFGAGGGIGQAVTVTSTGALIETFGNRSAGILAQSVGGGGGNGSFSIAGAGAGTGAGTFSLGGSGASGGKADTVNVTSSSSITTHGVEAQGIFAQSLGGGGGSGGFSIAGSGAGTGSGTVSIGGSGGGGGDGKIVTVTSTGLLIDTSGDRSSGIFAQSLGGGGGNGGFSIAGSGAGTGSGTLSVGGCFGFKIGDICSGGNGDTVNVNSSTFITTRGTEAYGIFAQSLGGGGGNGGFSIAGSGAGSGAGTLSIGGFGGGGGDAKGVTVTTQSETIETFGNGSTGIFAQSLGGGGGNGGFSIAGTGAGTGSGTLSLGGCFQLAPGATCAGGNAGVVTVNGDGTIITHGFNAHGIFAQSLGGGGGNGGFSLAGSGAGTGDGTLSVGGFGGNGGAGKNVKVITTGGMIQTFAARSTGIFAQSLGGGGGNGGFSFAGTFPTTARQVGVAVGGFGGGGGTGGNVTVNNNAAIETQGKSLFTGLTLMPGSIDMVLPPTLEQLTSLWGLSGRSHGILAQSIGGGGGTGGSSLALGFGLGGETWNLNGAVSVGGSGGAGNTGGIVDVTNTNSIITREDDSHGIFAQSVGGGGGEGGSSFAATISAGAANVGRTVNAEVSIGGSGGTGNDGGNVSVGNSGTIQTFGDESYGILAQSIGGGGGSGGDARGLSFLFKAGSAELGEGQTPGANWKLALNWGGNGGSANNGGKVTVNNTGSITTQGELSYGILAQSIGGGGGAGGDGIKGTGTKADYASIALIPAETKGGGGNIIKKTLLGQFRDISVTVGGDAGSNGDSDEVMVTNKGDVTTFGYGSVGILAQSVGGGGGIAQNFAKGEDAAGKAVSGATGRVGIGGAAAAGGNGGAVVVDHQGNIDTFGDEAHGIFAQSVGGGGGVAGTVDHTLATEVCPPEFVHVDKCIPPLNIGLGVGLTRDSGAGGNGSTVTVTSTGNITTRGIGAYGIFAQSVGGGGGAAAGLGLLDNLLKTFQGTAGAPGNAGVVTVTHSGNIITLGDVSDGIHAQSAGGQGSGGDVIITLSGNISAMGEGSHGIFAQSRGDAGASNISININSTVQGGSGVIKVTESGATTIDVPASGIAIFDGANNSVSNHGEITTLSGVAGNAIFATTGNDKIDNFGTVTGSVDLGGGSNAFNNKVDSTFNSGTTVNLGTGNLLTNEGTLSPGAKGTIYTSALTGNVMQTNTGTYAVDLDVGSASGSADRVNANGTANLAGLTDVNPVNAGFALPGSHKVTILSAAGGTTDSGLGLTAPSSAVATYQLLFPNPNDVVLDYSIDFSPASGLNINQTMIGNYINRVQLAGGSASLAPIVEALFFIPDASGLASAYDHLSPEPYIGLGTGTYFSNLQFSDSLLSCRSRDGQYRFVQEGQCGWMTVSGSALHEDRTSENLGFNRNGFSVSGGLQKQINKNWHVGVGIGYDKSWLDVHGIAESDANQVQGGATVKGQFGPAIFSVAVSGGHGWYDAKRFVNLPVNGVTAKADPGINFVANRLRLAYAFEQPAWYLKPMIDAAVTYVNLGGFRESGAAGANLNVRSQNETYFTLQPALEVGGELGRKDGLLFRPFARAGLIHLFTGDSPGITASMQGAPAGVTPFTVKGKNDLNTGEVSLGVDILGVNGMNLRIGYTGQFSPRTEAHGGAIKFSIPF
ncbi:MAG: hypothetical protein ACM3TN_11070 [Alphaproteobacteria bacterium]